MSGKTYLFDSYSSLQNYHYTYYDSCSYEREGAHTEDRHNYHHTNFKLMIKWQSIKTNYLMCGIIIKTAAAYQHTYNRTKQNLQQDEEYHWIFGDIGDDHLG